MSFFDRILKAITGGDAKAVIVTTEQLNLLKQSLEPLAKASPALPEKALEFILQGTQETVLLDLQNAQSVQTALPGILLGSPGRLRWQFYHYDDKSLEKLGEKSLAARNKLYCGIDTSKFPLDILVRMAKVLAAGDDRKSLEHPGAPIPDWFQYLINDILFASGNRPIGHRDLTHAEAAKETVWNLSFFAKLLSHEGLDPMLVLQVAFERKDLDTFYHDHLHLLVTPPSVAQFMLENPNAVNLLPTLIGAAGRMILSRRIGKDKSLAQVFAPLTVRLAADSSKGVRTEAGLHLDAIDATQRLELLAVMLNTGSSAERGQAADWLARMQDDRANTLLEAALAAGPTKSVAQAIRAALSRMSASGDTTTVDLKAAPPWVPIEGQMLGDSALSVLRGNHADVLELDRIAAEEEANSPEAIKYKRNYMLLNYKRTQKITDKDLRSVLAALNGKSTKIENSALRNNGVVALVSFQNRLQALPEFGIVHILRWLAVTREWSCFWMDYNFQVWLAKQPYGSVDLRALADVLKRSSWSNAYSEVAATSLRHLYETPLAIQVLPAHCVWPFFAENPQLIDEGLGLTPASTSNVRDSFDMSATLETLAIFPTIPPRWLPRLMELALGEGKTHRAAAQKTLTTLPDIGQRVMESLDASKSEVRIEAANWLADLQYKPAIPALIKLLEKETRETARAAFLTSLEALGEDISPRLAPSILLAEAKKGLKAKAPAGLAWFKTDAIPECNWNDGSLVEPEILQWWVVLACKLKEPGGNALLSRYLGLLAPTSRAAFGRAVLHQFVAQDISCPDLAAGIEHAQSYAPARWQSYQDQYNNTKAEYKEYYLANYQKTKDQVFEECKREKMSAYFGSAIGEKGILALTAHAPAHEAVTLLQQYMRDHYQRRAQIEAMLEGIAVGNDSVVIQLLLGISRRYRTASVQEKARGLVQQIADKNKWTQDQLADRTIPTAGLDETGKLELAYGERTFHLVLDTAMKPELRNAEGKAIKALPDARQNDDPAIIKEAKTQLTTSKKELKQVIDLQTARLVEAMCVGRIWPQNEWREYLHAHPIVGRLIQRVIWLEINEDQSIRATFRTTEDGSLINTDDDEVTLATTSAIRLAHASLVPDAVASAWTAHLKDYKITPLFAQMTRKSPDIAFTDKNGSEIAIIDDRLGWLSDSFTLRGAFTKLGYKRAAAEDGGFFYQYTKRFESVGVTVVLEFSGNCLPEENVPAALKTLSFEDSKSISWSDRTVALKKVPPVLLAEAYADYLAVAQACAGFDADWEKKMRW